MSSYSRSPHLWIMALLGSLPLSASDSKTNVLIEIRLYNIAHVPRETLTRAARVAAQLLRQASIDAAWEYERAFPTDIPRGVAHRDLLGPTVIVLRIYTCLWSKPTRLSRNSLGFVLSFDNNTAAILYTTIQELAHNLDVDQAQLLGIAMAHEVGHLLLGSQPHSLKGIMRPSLSKSDLYDGLQGLLRFTPEQTRLMREEALTRARHCQDAGESHRTDSE
jgi:hypothetical protein